MKMIKELIKELKLDKIAWGVVIGIIFIYAFSWLATCGIIKIITLCFGWDFSWAVATGIWLVMCLVKKVLGKVR
jgi:hypothetical protein